MKTIKIILSFVFLLVFSSFPTHASLPSFSPVLPSSDDHVSTSDLEILDNGMMFAVVSPFLYQSQDKGVTWTKSVSVPSWGPVNDLSSKGNTLYLATFRGVYETKDNGVSFSQLYSSGSASCVEMYVSPKGTLLAACPYLLKSEDEGLTWQEAKTYPYPNLYLNHLSFPSAEEIFALSLVDPNHLYYSSDSGKLWTNVIPNLYPPDIKTYLIDPKDITRIFLGTGNGLYEVRNAMTATASFSLVTSIIPVSYELVPPSSWQIPALGLLPAKESSFSSYLLAAVGDKGLYYSTDSAKTFSPSSFIGQSGHYISKIFSVRNSKKTFLSLSDSSPPGLFSLIVPPPYHPVVFIHGLGGRPGDWDVDHGTSKSMVKRLKEIGYEDKWAKSYGYYDYNSDGVYDYEGEVDKIALGLPALINELSESHIAEGGDGKVDIVGHSLGGLVARSYFSTSAFNNKIRRFIDVATPHQGNNLALLNNVADAAPLHEQWKKPFADYITDVGKSFFRGTDGVVFHTDSPAAYDLSPVSPFIINLNRPENSPQSIDYNLLYGDIHAKLCRRIFHMKFCKDVSLGDILISTKSATTIPGTTPKLYPFSADFEDTIELGLKVKKTGDGYKLEVTGPDLKITKAWRYSHFKGFEQDDVKEKIKELLIK